MLLKLHWHMGIMPHLVLALLAGTLPNQDAVAVLADSYALRTIADLPFYPILRLVTADADHDRTPEFYVYTAYETLRVVEHMGGNQFRSYPLPVSPCWFCWAGGDADRDGKTDLVIQDQIRFLIYESPDSASFPTRLVWSDSTPHSGERNRSIVADMDQDSAREIILNDGYQRVIKVYENSGDNRYAPRGAVLPPDSLDEYEFVQTGDMDHDGRPELAIGSWSTVTFCEATAHDSFRRVGTCSVTYNNLRFDALATGPDIDRDGRAEVIAFGVTQHNLGLLIVCESPASDSFEIVWRDSCESPYFGEQDIAVGDMDGDSIPEIAVSDAMKVRLYRCIGNDRYDQFTEAESPYPGAVAISDVNTDGRGELLYGTEEGLVIAEWLSTGVEDRTAEALRRVDVWPSVVRSRGVVQVSGLPSLSEVEVVDASGRVVSSSSLRASSFVLGTSDLKAGAHFIRIRLGNQSVVRKVLVVD